MSDLISRFELFNALATIRSEDIAYQAEVFKIVQGMKEKDAVPVVRCEDCKHLAEDGICKINWIHKDVSGFCDFGERRING